MYSPDSVIFVITVVLAVYFMVEGTDLPFNAKDVDEGTTPGEIYAYIKAIGFPLVSAGFWRVASIFAVDLNNCVSSFGGPPGGCYTSPTFATTTSTVTQAIGAQLALFFNGLFYINIVFTIAMSLYLVLWPVVMTLRDRRKPMDASEVRVS